jgi:hypothetical protein
MTLPAACIQVSVFISIDSLPWNLDKIDKLRMRIYILHLFSVGLRVGVFFVGFDWVLWERHA